jgi:hypothetical protein
MGGIAELGDETPVGSSSLEVKRSIWGEFDAMTTAGAVTSEMKMSGMKFCIPTLMRTVVAMCMIAGGLTSTLEE